MKVLVLFICMVTAAVGADSERVELEPGMQVSEIAPGVWLHVSRVPEFNAPANGLIVVGEGEAVMIDTPWSEEQTGRLFDWTRERFGLEITHVVPTHYHVDCMGGLGEAHRRGADSTAHDRTAAYARRDSLPVPKRTFGETGSLTVGGVELELRHFGASHTPDCITVWLPATKILFAGDIARGGVKGNVSEADQRAWPGTARAVIDAYPAAAQVIPGHGRPGGLELLRNAIRLFSEAP